MHNRDAPTDEKLQRHLYRSTIMQSAEVMETLMPRTTVHQEGKPNQTYEATAHECAIDLIDHIKTANSGNSSGLEIILLSQIQVLDRLQLDNLRRYKAAKQADDAKWYQERALQAQEQCRASIAALITLRATSQNRKISGNDSVG